MEIWHQNVRFTVFMTHIFPYIAPLWSRAQKEQLSREPCCRCDWLWPDSSLFCLYSRRVIPNNSCLSREGLRTEHTVSWVGKWLSWSFSFLNDSLQRDLNVRKARPVTDDTLELTGTFVHLLPLQTPSFCLNRISRMERKNQPLCRVRWIRSHIFHSKHSPC